MCRAGLDGDVSINILKNEFNYEMEVPDPVRYLESKGMEVNFLTPGAEKAFRQATDSVYDKWVPKIGKDLYETAKQDMAE